MELEIKNNSQDNFQIMPIIVNNKTSKSQIYLKISNFLIIVFLFFSLIFFILYKNHGNKSSNLSRLNDELSDKKNIDSNYKRVSPNDEKYIYIPIIGTNDFHGRFFPQINEINYNSKKTKYKTGGLEYIAKYINILRDEFGKNRVLYFDLGDQFFQTNETILFDGNNIQDFLNKIGVNGTILGNHEFLYERKWIENKIKNARYPYIVNNIQDKITNKKKRSIR